MSGTIRGPGAAAVNKSSPFRSLHGSRVLVPHFDGGPEPKRTRGDNEREVETPWWSSG